MLEPAGIHAPRLAEYFGALIDYAEEAKWGKRSHDPRGGARAVRGRRGAAA